jgi:protein O-mannosyl-transferase
MDEVFEVCAGTSPSRHGRFDAPAAIEVHSGVMSSRRDRLPSRDTRSTRAHSPQTGRSLTPRRGAWLLLGVLLVATLAAYQPAWHGGLLWDDAGHITRTDLQSVDGLRRIWVEVGATQQYYPLVHSTFWLLHRLWGDSTLGYHLVSIVLHACSAFLLALILRRLGVAWPWLAAMVFALHPVHVESVAWIAELKNTQSGVLFLASALAYLHFDQSRNARIYALATGLFVLALLSKTVTATLPALLLVVFWWQRGSLGLRRDVAPLAPWLAVGAGFGALTAWTERALVGARGPEFHFTIVERGLVAGRAVWFYLGKLVWPVDLAFIYPKWEMSGQTWWQYLYPAGVVALVAVLWFWRRRTRAPLAAMLWFCGSLVPALGFVNVYPFRYSFVADHFQYLASIGIITLFTGAVAALVGRLRRPARWMPATAVVILVPLAALTWRQSHDYTDAETLYRATIARSPSSFMALNNLAVLELPTSVEQAKAHLEAALKYNPDYAEAHNNLGLALQVLGRLDEAAAEHAAALRLEPGFADAHDNLGAVWQKMGRLQDAAAQYAEAIRLRPGRAEAHGNLGNALLLQGHPEEAVPRYREALRIDPALADIRFNLATALQRTGRNEQATAEYQAVLRTEPENADAHAGLAATLETIGRLDEAAVQYEAVVRLEPGLAPPHLKLANIFYRKSEWQRAASEYEVVVGRDPGSGVAHNNLGACLERMGRFDEAAAQYREAVRLLPQSTDARANLARAVALMSKRG